MTRPGDPTRRGPTDRGSPGRSGPVRRSRPRSGTWSFPNLASTDSSSASDESARQAVDGVASRLVDPHQCADVQQLIRGSPQNLGDRRIDERRRGPHASRPSRIRSAWPRFVTVRDRCRWRAVPSSPPRRPAKSSPASDASSGSSPSRPEQGTLDAQDVGQIGALTHAREKLGDVSRVEAPAKQLVDRAQLRQVVVVVERRTADPARRVQQATLAIGADIAGTDAGDPRQLIEAVLSQRSAPRSRSGRE